MAAGSKKGSKADTHGAKAARPDGTGGAKAGPRTEPNGGFREQVTTLGLAILIALSVRHFAIEPFRIPSGSMFPTLLIGDHLFVNKFIYGAKIPFTDIRLPKIREPERGDVVVFTVAKHGHNTYPADRKPDLPREEFVKRVIGLPGDEIDFRAGKIYINGEVMDSDPLPEPFVDPGGTRLDQAAVSLGDHDFVVLDDPRRIGPHAGWPIRVEEGRYFMMGDNRDHSKDSRVWGTVRLEEIRGPAFILYYSWDFNGDWLEVLNPLTWWRVEKRWDRFGKLVH